MYAHKCQKGFAFFVAVVAATDDGDGEEEGDGI